jgi:ElaB/YqjD/DUF883 family membrane-anchored ribosome-binding protein
MKSRHDSGSTGSAGSSTETPEQLIEHISRLMAEAEAMIAGPHTEQSNGKLANIKERLEAAREQLTDVYSRAREGVVDAYGRARKGVVASAQYTDQSIRTHPYQTAAIALGVGVLIGALIRRGNSSNR